MMRPMNDPALLVPFIFTIKSDTVPHSKTVHARGNINIMADQKCLADAVTPVFLVFGLGGPAGQLGSLLYIGVSLVLTAIRSDGGCEVMTIPGMLMGKRTHLVCIVFSPLDWIEDRLVGSMSTARNESS